MLPSLLFRTLRTVSPRLLAKFAWNFGAKSALSVTAFKMRLRRGEVFPAFLQLSILNSCNLRCQGCWVDVDAPRRMLELETVNRIIRDANRHGNYFFGLLGGEPFLHPQLFDILAAHPGCYFQIFTNGQAITAETAAHLRQLGNATPLVSVEGSSVISDTRRGSHEVFDKSMRGLQHCLEAGLITGVATSVCQSNIDDLLTEAWLKELIRLGAHYVWFYTYRPVGARSNPQLALSLEQIERVRRFTVEMRAKLPIGIADCYYDHAGHGLCPMTTGLSHHIGPGGDIEPCPLIQFAIENVNDPRGLFAAIRDSAFLKDLRETAARTTRGCLILERPDLVSELVARHGARDTTQRGTVLAELAAMHPLPSHADVPPIPDRHWLYWLAKRCGFNDFGAYKNAPAKSEKTERNPS